VASQPRRKLRDRPRPHRGWRDDGGMIHLNHGPTHKLFRSTPARLLRFNARSGHLFNKSRLFASRSASFPSSA
jgi:hypothetical protein